MNHALGFDRFGRGDLDALIGLEQVAVGREERRIHAADPAVVELERPVIRGAEHAVTPGVGTRRQERVVGIGRVRGCLDVAFAAIRIDRAESQRRQELVIQAR